MPLASPNWIQTENPIDDETISIAFVVVDDFSMISFSSAIEPIYLANKVAGRNLYSYAILSEDGKARRASNGLEMNVTGCYEKVRNVDVIVVCGGVGINHQDHKSLQTFLRRSCACGAKLGAVHTGTYVLVKAGLLGGYKAAIHWEYLSSLNLEDGDALIAPNAFEIDRNRFTSAGGTASTDMMLSLILRDHGFEVASKVADHLIHRHVRVEGDAQKMNVRLRLGISHPKLVRVIELMESAMSEPVSGPELADAVRLSTRQLERLFLKYTGCPPNRYYLRMRLEYARSIIRQTSIPILSVALESGFLSASHFSKAYLNHFGVPPSTDRKSNKY